MHQVDGIRVCVCVREGRGCRGQVDTGAACRGAPGPWQVDAQRIEIKKRRD